MPETSGKFLIIEISSVIHGATRIKATRCETLRTVTTNYSKKTLTFDILPQCMINGPKVNGYDFFHFWTHFINSPWIRSFFIRHNQYLIWNLKTSSQNGSPELKKSELVHFFLLLTPFYWLSMKTIYFDISQPYSIWNF